MVEDGTIFKIEYITRFNILKINTEIQEDLVNDDVPMKILNQQGPTKKSHDKNLIIKRDKILESNQATKIRQSSFKKA